MTYEYRVVQRGPGEWAIHRRLTANHGWVTLAWTDNQPDAELIVAALKHAEARP